MFGLTTEKKMQEALAAVRSEYLKELVQEKSRYRKLVDEVEVLQLKHGLVVRELTMRKEKGKIRMEAELNTN